MRKIKLSSQVPRDYIDLIKKIKLNQKIAIIMVSYIKELVYLNEKDKAKLFQYIILTRTNITDNRKFWKTLKPMLPNKSVANEKTILVEN